MSQTDRLGADLAASHAAPHGYRRAPSAVSWGAVIAGAVGMTAFSLILIMLGTGLGLSSLSPWPGNGMHARAFGVAAIIWICVTQLMSAGLGGYLAGRLRRHWPGASLDETHFRDSVHGFLAWSVATLLSAIVLTSALSGVARLGVAQAGAAAPAMTGSVNAAERGDARAAYETWPIGYFIDSMLRPAAGTAAAATSVAQDTAPAAAVLAEQNRAIGRIFLNALPARGALAPADAAYLARIVAQRTGLAPADAQTRVATIWSGLVSKLNALDDASRAAADKARRITIHVTLWLFISLLMGAFAASLMATVGGRMREP